MAQPHAQAPAKLAVLFDMDGLMLDTEQMARRAWTSALADHGYALEEADYLRLLGRTSPDVEGMLYEIFGASLPYAEVFQARQSNYEGYIEREGVPLKPGLLNLLDLLEEYDVPKAVASSTGRAFLMHKLERAGIAGRFPVIVSGDQVARGKPQPDIFLEAARRLQVSAGECLVLEDSEAGILAAHRAGMLAIMVPDLKPPSGEIAGVAYKVLPSLAEVIPLVMGFIVGGLPER